MKKLIPLLLLPLLPGCMNMASVVHELQNDPATVHFNVSTLYGSVSFDRSFPTNWTPVIVPAAAPAPVVKGP